jgi:hypothetical protein
MGVAIKITRTEHDAASLRAAASKLSDGAQVHRMLALALVMEGWSRKAAAELNGMDRQTLSDRAHRYNPTLTLPGCMGGNSRGKTKTSCWCRKGPCI